MITPDTSKYLPQMGLSLKRGSATELRIVGLPLIAFPRGTTFETSAVESPDNMENHHEEVHTLRCSCNSLYIPCNSGNGTASDLGTGILCAVLSQRELSE